MKRAMMGVLAVMSALALGAACEQKGSGSAERGGTSSMPTARGPGGETGTRSGSSATAPGASASAGSASSSDLSGTGGSGDAGKGHADAGMR